MSVFEILQSLDDKGSITIQYRDFGGEMGIFLESINDVGGDDDYWWQYWINGEYSQVGISRQFVEPDDHIRFEYTGGNY